MLEDGEWLSAPSMARICRKLENGCSGVNRTAQGHLDSGFNLIGGIEMNYLRRNAWQNGFIIGLLGSLIVVTAFLILTLSQLDKLNIELIETRAELTRHKAAAVYNYEVALELVNHRFRSLEKKEAVIDPALQKELIEMAKILGLKVKDH